MAVFFRALTVTERTTVVDLGGAASTWDWLDVRPRLVLVNLDADCPRDGFDSVVADALASPFRDGSFDVVFSNSLIEHLGTKQRQEAFASEVRRLSKTGYFVQTPNKWFPIEPHYLAPLVQFVPRKIRPAVIRWMTPFGWLRKPSREECRGICREIRLLSAREMRRLFPDADIVRERFLGVTKSLMAVRRSNGAGAARPIQRHPAQTQ